jgi:subtilase family serine protease
VPAAGASAPGQAVRERAVCAAPGDPTVARCASHVVTLDDGVTPAGTATYQGSGLTPLQLRTAYGLDISSATPTVAIVDAFDAPDIERALATYRGQFQLPSCTTANGCFSIVRPQGVPAVDTGWAVETALDVDMASAICPSCRIVLVQALTNSWANLTGAVDAARQIPGVVAISNSYAGGEFRAELTDAYNGPYQRARQQGIAVTASSGDGGYGTLFPASSPDVVAVGGTSLYLSSSGGYGSETAWSGAGSGCSTYVAKPAYQSPVKGCSNRAVADVSAVADPATGVAVFGYDSASASNAWLVVGGTSASSPIIAAVYALAGRTRGTVPAAASLYKPPAGALHDVTSGSNGTCRKAAALCTAGPGYDGPTGVGTPNGSGAF